MTRNLIETLQDITDNTAEFIHNHKTISMGPCTKFNEFRNIVDPTALDLAIKKCNLYEETIKIHKAFNLASKNLLACVDSPLIHSMGPTTIDTINQPNSIIAQFLSSQCQPSIDQWNKMLQENNEIDSQRIELQSQIQSFCELSGHNEYTIKICDSVL